MLDLKLYLHLITLHLRIAYYARARDYLIVTRRGASQDALAIEWRLVELNDARKNCERRLSARLRT